MVSDQDFCAETEAMMKEDFGRARRVDYGEYARRPWWFKTGVRMARLLSPVQ